MGRGWRELDTWAQRDVQTTHWRPSHTAAPLRGTPRLPGSQQLGCLGRVQGPGRRGQAAGGRQGPGPVRQASQHLSSD